MSLTISKTDDSQRLAHIYRQRAARLAARKPAAAVQATIPVLVFELYPEQYAVELTSVMQVMPLTNCTPVPSAPVSLLGVINLRGEIRSVIDLRQILDLSSADEPSLGHLILLSHQENVVGARVDQVQRVRHVSPDELMAPSEELTRLNGRFVRGVTADKVIVLDTATIFSHSIFKANSISEK